MKLLVLNSGSSSLKFKIFQSNETLEEIAKGMIDGIGMKTCKFILKSKQKNIGQKFKIKNHVEAINLTLKTLLNTGIIKDYKDIIGVGHRVVHGGENYSEPTKIDAKVLKKLEKLSELAPLHNPANLLGIHAIKKALPRTPQVAVFDTAFHQTMEEKAYLYGLPSKFYKKYGIRKYGFHGTSHKYVTNEALKQFRKKNVKIISCHLGNGVSITASLNGKSVDTSMGFTPLEGTIMGTRSGSIDPAIIFYLISQKFKPDNIEEMLINESGLLGLSEVSSDMRLIYEKSKKDDKKAKLAMEIFCYQIAKYCGAYTASLNGLDGIVFTGGIGENADYIRESICEYLSFLNIKIDKKKNKNSELEISDKKSAIKVFAIPTNEEKQIAIETLKVL